MATVNQKIEAVANYSKRTFTLRSYIGGIFSSKYRTLPMSKDEFNSCLYNTSNDWINFLKSDEYTVVKK